MSSTVCLGVRALPPHVLGRQLGNARCISRIRLEDPTSFSLTRDFAKYPKVIYRGLDHYNTHHNLLQLD